MSGISESGHLLTPTMDTPFRACFRCSTRRPETDRWRFDVEEPRLDVLVTLTVGRSDVTHQIRAQTTNLGSYEVAECTHTRSAAKI